MLHKLFLLGANLIEIKGFVGGEESGLL